MAIAADALVTSGLFSIVVCNIDPFNAQEGVTVVPAHLGVAPAFRIRDELSGEEYDWRLGRNYVRLDPWGHQVHVFRVLQ